MVAIQSIHLLPQPGVISVLKWSHIKYMFTFSVRKCLVLEQKLNALDSNQGLQLHKSIHLLPQLGVISVLKYRAEQESQFNKPRIVKGEKT